ncbi:hypothetical protein CPG38_05750 [Malaciobacter marinus]|uniref:hypothetical protein n=1 Tax=Malaciobacter marinus TaxID=505249 RepID=UPI000C08323A|nr:hypothetical protein [Malaciobacter marinus]PHO12770.1 hypothetical protein CPG38_05750 [Malaciobacter marinus]
MIINTQNININPIQKDIKQLKDEVKIQLDNKTVAEILSFIGYEISKDYKFIHDKSFSISRDGFIKDWGQTGFSGDIFDFIMKEKNIQLPKAIKFVADCLGVKYD